MKAEIRNEIRFELHFSCSDEDDWYPTKFRDYITLKSAVEALNEKRSEGYGKWKIFEVHSMIKPVDL
jgi:hypothetical protein